LGEWDVVDTWTVGGQAVGRMEDVMPKSPALRRETPRVCLYSSLSEGVSSLGPKALDILREVKMIVPLSEAVLQNLPSSNGR